LKQQCVVCLPCPLISTRGPVRGLADEETFSQSTIKELHQSSSSCYETAVDRYLHFPKLKGIPLIAHQYFHEARATGE